MMIAVHDNPGLMKQFLPPEEQAVNEQEQIVNEPEQVANEQEINEVNNLNLKDLLQRYNSTGDKKPEKNIPNAVNGHGKARTTDDVMIHL